MTTSAVFKVRFGIVLLVLSGPTAFAQFSADSPVGISAGLAKLFGGVNGFVARADVQVLDTNRQETLRTPMGFAFLDGKMRMEIDLSQIRGRSVSPGVIAVLKQAGLDRVVSIVRLDKKMIHVVFSGVRSYANMELSGADADAAQKNLRIQKTLLARETVDGHACARNRVVVKDSKGVALLEATTWNAADLKDFPVQIALQTKDNATIVHFNQIRLARPDAAQFEPPAGYARFNNTDSLLMSAAQKALAAQKPAAASGQNPPPKARGAATPGSAMRK